MGLCTRVLWYSSYYLSDRPKWCWYVTAENHTVLLGAGQFYLLEVSHFLRVLRLWSPYLSRDICELNLSFLSLRESHLTLASIQLPHLCPQTVLPPPCQSRCLHTHLLEGSERLLLFLTILPPSKKRFNPRNLLCSIHLGTTILLKQIF